MLRGIGERDKARMLRNSGKMKRRRQEMKDLRMLKREADIRK